MAAEDNKALVRRMMEQLPKGWDEQAAEMFAPDWVNIDPGLPPMRGHEGARQLFTIFSTAFPNDVSITVHRIIAEGDTVAANFTFGGTHEGEFMGMPPTGKRVEVTGTGMFRLADGQLVENRVNFDTLGLLQQLGVAPAPGA
jgi:steroid delta-isomerase-like uncharacterized protein